MPKKLLDCIHKVMKQGKDESTAIAICIKSTGLKMKHSEVEDLIQNRDNITESDVDLFIDKVKNPQKYKTVITKRDK